MVFELAIEADAIAFERPGVDGVGVLDVADVDMLELNEAELSDKFALELEKAWLSREPLLLYNGVDDMDGDVAVPLDEIPGVDR